MHAKHFRDSAMNVSPAWELERYLPLLRVHARQVQLHPRLQRRFDASDLVQDAFSRAHKGLAGCGAQTEGEMVGRLLRILARVAIDNVRAARAGKRDLGMEEVIPEAVTSTGWNPADRGPSPSTDAANHEIQLQVAAAIDQLP